MIRDDHAKSWNPWTTLVMIYDWDRRSNFWNWKYCLDGIDCFVLLDLLGGPNPQFQNHFKETDNNHKHMRAIESRLHSMGELQEHRSANQYFTTSRSYAGRISDDHIPFLQRGKCWKID